jgi:hypothetical protein
MCPKIRQTNSNADLKKELQVYFFCNISVVIGLFTSKHASDQHCQELVELGAPYEQIH